MADHRWESITGRKLVAFAGGAIVFLIVLLASPPGFVLLLDFANLLFHEAGHPTFGMLYDRLGVYGGTLGQLTFPVILMISFWRKAHPIPFAAAWIWFFENWLNISRYMADSRELELPLVGGGDHDWNEIFFRWNVLSYDTAIANITRILGWIGIITACLWVAWRAWVQHRDDDASGPLYRKSALADKSEAWPGAGNNPTSLTSPQRLGPSFCWQ